MNRTSVEEIKTRLPIDEVVGSYIKLEKSGKSLKAKCPFHNEKTGSFFVSPDRGGYYCFGCGAKGDIFSFVQQFEGLDFRGALKILAEKAGVPLSIDRKADGERDVLFQVMEEATKFFENQYIQAKPAQEYVKSRGLSNETQKVFRIGWAPDGWKNILTCLKSKGWNEMVIEKAGLIKRKENSSDYYDRFRGRVMFPIADSSGRIIAFSGRILVDDGKSAKYINSPDSLLYDKSAVLYGLDKAKSEIRRLNYSILVEGQMDLVMSHQAGIKNTVAASGTALSDEMINREGIVNNLGLIRRLSPNVIIAFDSDNAGRKAALRAAGIALSIGMDVKIADIIGGKDPADLVKENVELWRKSLREAKHVVEFELDNVMRDVSDSRKISHALRDRVLPFVAVTESHMDKAHFVKMIADRAKIKDDAVWQDLNVVEKKIQTETMGQTNAISKQSGGMGDSVSNNDLQKIDMVERHLLGLLNLMESNNHPKIEEYKEQLKKVAGDSYTERLERTKTNTNDLIFEAENYFGDKQEEWDRHFKEMLFNFEKDIINEQLILTMQELRQAEKENNQERVVELAKKCQELSMRKVNIKAG